MNTDTTMTPEQIERYTPLWEEAYAALRADTGTLIDLANLARKAVERAAQRPAGRRSVAVRSGNTERVQKKVDRSARSKAWAKHTRSTPEERMVSAERRAAQRARRSDQEREANNQRQRELRQAAEAAMSAEQLQAKREARRAAERARIAALTPEEREARRQAERERSAARHAALTPEQVAARKARQAASYQRRRDAGL